MRADVQPSALVRDVTGGPDPACRSCGAVLREGVADLGLLPAHEGCVPATRPAEPRMRSLSALVCTDCRLVQLAEPALPGGTPAAEAVGLAEGLRLGPHTPVFGLGGHEPALRAFAERGIAVRALDAGLLGPGTAQRLRAEGDMPALLLLGHALSTGDDPHMLLQAVRLLLAPGGVAVLEVPPLLWLLQGLRYHAFSHRFANYPSLLVAELICGLHGLTVFGVETLPGTPPMLRLLLRHAEDGTKPVSPAVQALRAEERAAGLEGAEAYRRFARRVLASKCEVLDFLVGVRRAGQSVVGQGASPAVDRLLCWCGVGPELLPLTVDATPGRQGLLLPGSRIPVLGPQALDAEHPDFLLLLEEDAAPRDFGGRMVRVVPALELL